MPHVLVIEDEGPIRRGLENALTRLGHDVTACEKGLDGLRVVIEKTPDVVILDLGLPDIDGVDLLKMIRSSSQVPVLVASARDAEGDIIRSLDLGADDHVVKPYSPEQIEARIRAVLRRAADRQGPDTIVVGGLEIDPAARVATLDGEELPLTRLEFDLLHALATRAGQVVTRRQLFADVWRRAHGDDKTVDVHVSALRSKLGETGTSPRYIHTVRGVGLKLVAP